MPITIKTIGEKILNDFREKKNNSKIGLWIFKYYNEAEKLETWIISTETPILLPQDKTIGRVLRAEISEGLIRYGEGTIGYLLASKEPVIVGDTEADPRGIVSLSDREIGQKSAFCYPIKREDKLIGVLDFFHSDNNYFQPSDDIKILKRILNPHEDSLIFLHEIELRKETRKSLAEVPHIPESPKALVLQVKKYLSFNLPISLIVYQENSRYIPKVVDFDEEFLKTKFFREVNWCSYKSSKCKGCFLEDLPQNSTNEYDPCFLHNILSELGRNWHRDQIKLSPSSELYSILYFSTDKAYGL